MKKGLVFLLLAALVFSPVFAGGSSESSDSGKDQLLWLYESATAEHEQHLRTDLIEVVNSRADDYEFEIRFDPNYDQNVRTQLLAGAGPDLVLTAGPSYVQELAKEGYLYSLDEFAAQYGWNDILFPMMLDLGSVDGHLYALPKTYESMVIFYNKTLFDEHGWSIPETWEEFDALCQEIKDAGVIPLVNGNSSWRPTNEHLVTYFFNHIAGPDKIYQALNDEIPWTDEAFVEAMDELVHFFNDYYSPDYFSYADEDCLAVIADGSVAMYISGTWNFQRMDEFFGETGQDWDWAPIPVKEGLEYPLYAIGVGATLSINQKTARPDAVAELLNTLFTDKAVQVQLNVDWPGEWILPINTLNREDFGDKIDARFAACIDEMSDAINAGKFGYVTWTFWPEKTDQYIWEQVENVFLGNMSSIEYLEGLDAAFQADYDVGNSLPVPSSV